MPFTLCSFAIRSHFVTAPPLINYITSPWFLSRKRTFLCSSEVTAPRLISYFYNISSIYMYSKSFLMVSFVKQCPLCFYRYSSQKRIVLLSLCKLESFNDPCYCFRPWHIMSINCSDHFPFWVTLRLVFASTSQHSDFMWNLSFASIIGTRLSFIDGCLLRITWFPVRVAPFVHALLG